MTELTRRQLLAGALGAATLGAGDALAIGDGSKLKLAQIEYAGTWDSRPMASLVLAQEVRFRTSIDVQLKRQVVRAEDAALFDLPFVTMLGDVRFKFQPRERVRLKKWIEAGGMLFVDNTGRSEPSEAFDASLRAELDAMFPGQKLAKVPSQHVLYRCFYVLDFPAGRAIRRTFLEALSLEGRLAVIYSQNDLTGALDRDRVGAWTFDVEPGGEPQREKARRLAVNLIQYAMCLDYKDDQVHLDYLLHQRRWRSPPPGIRPEDRKTP